MTDDLVITSGPDSTHVNVKAAHERRYWMHRFGVSEAALRQAVAQVGLQVDRVEAFLASHPHLRPGDRTAARSSASRH